MSSFTAYAFPFVLFLAFFSLNNKSGELSLVKPLDFEAAVQYVLNVSASDMGEPRRRAFSNVTINVTDVNDNSPVLQARIIQASVAEVSKFEAHLTLPWLQDYESAFFGRKARNGEFILIKKIIAFKIPAFNVFLCMKDAATVFWKTESISTIHQYGLSSYLHTSSVSFSSRLILLQGASSGSFVVQCNASDADTAANARITYQLVEGAVNRFSIDNITGVITTSGSFDRETDPELYTVRPLLRLNNLILYLRVKKKHQVS